MTRAEGGFKFPTPMEPFRLVDDRMAQPSVDSTIRALCLYFSPVVPVPGTSQVLSKHLPGERARLNLGRREFESSRLPRP